MTPGYRASLSPMTLDVLPPEIRSRLYSSLIPGKVEFVGSRAAIPSRWSHNPMLALMQVFPHLAEEINGELYSRPRFEFVTSRIGKNNWVHALEVAAEFFNLISPEKTDRVRKINCDIHWQKRSESPNEIFQLLERLAACPPKREIRNIGFHFQPSFEVKRSIYGVRSKTFGFSLRGLIGVDITIFIVGLHGLLPNPYSFVRFMNKWIRGRRETVSPLRFLTRTPPEIHKDIYEHFNLPRYHIVSPHTGSESTSDILSEIESEITPLRIQPMLLHHPTMTAGLLPLVYGKCHFFFAVNCACRACEDETADVSNPAPWIMSFLRQIGPVNTSYLRKATIQLSVCDFRYNDYLPPVKSIVRELNNRCAFNIDEKYLSEPSKVEPKECNMTVHKKSYRFTIPTRATAKLTVEIFLPWQQAILDDDEKQRERQLMHRIFRDSMAGIFNGLLTMAKGANFDSCEDSIR